MSQTPRSPLLWIANMDRREPEIPPFPLRIVWWRVFTALGPSFEVYRQPPPEQWFKLEAIYGRERVEAWDNYLSQRAYFPRTERRWKRIRDAILKRRGCALPRDTAKE